MNSGSGRNPVNGTPSSDNLFGTSAQDSIRGFGGGDVLAGGAGADYYDGGAGNDRYVLDDASAIDELFFHSDANQQDILDVSNLLPASVDAASLKNFLKVTDKGVYLDSGGQGQFSTESQIAKFAANNPPMNAMIAVQIADTSVIQFDWTKTASIPLIGSVQEGQDEAENQITGTDQADNLVGTDMADVIRAGAGNDIINGGAGADLYDGGDGDDRYILANTDAADTVNFRSDDSQRDILDISELLPAGVNGQNLKNY